MIKVSTRRLTREKKKKKKSTGSLKPLMLWSRVLTEIRAKGVVMQLGPNRFDELLEQFCAAFELLAKVCFSFVFRVFCL
jgi:hypothetical protein